jgi:hypothetical protein
MKNHFAYTMKITFAYQHKYHLSKHSYTPALDWRNDLRIKLFCE